MNDSVFAPALDWYFHKLVLTLPQGQRARQVLTGVKQWPREKIQKEADRVLAHVGFSRDFANRVLADEVPTRHVTWPGFFEEWVRVISDYGFAAERLVGAPLTDTRVVASMVLRAAKARYQRTSDSYDAHTEESEGVQLPPIPPVPPVPPVNAGSRDDGSVSAFDAF
ncbi:MAG: hypothetical protein CL902_00620 [Dehalococcoidia bacterium]|nr:hypothetical protein [Dehalococcoidia bacterium]